MEALGYMASVLIGISLGLMGGGGSILTVPVLVYLFGIQVVTATAYSLFVVGLTSAVGSVSYFKDKLINLQTAAVFGAPSIVAVYLTRAYIVPAIPTQIIETAAFSLSKDTFLLLLFAVLMIAAAYSMLKKNEQDKDLSSSARKFNYPLIVLEGTVVGILTGLVGAGGGFLIIPALVVLSKLPMKEAVGTSLLIIAAKSLLGFLGESSSTVIDWTLLGFMSAAAIGGILVGIGLSKKIDGNKLKPAFGWFVLLMGAYIILKETLLK